MLLPECNTGVARFPQALGLVQGWREILEPRAFLLQGRDTPESRPHRKGHRIASPGFH